MISELAERINDYESGALEQEEVVALFQELVDSGVVWQLQGSYGRQAMAFIKAGMVEVR